MEAGFWSYEKRFTFHKAALITQALLKRASIHACASRDFFKRQYIAKNTTIPGMQGINFSNPTCHCRGNGSL
jgi:hypothetical protein